jgi:hypothetical protein
MAEKERLQVKLFPNWTDYSKNNPEGPLTYINTECKTINPMQITYAIYNKGKNPNSSLEDLVKMNTEFGEKHELTIINSCTGNCTFGKYATAIWGSDSFQWFQIWHLTNGKDFIFVIYICEIKPESRILDEAHSIVLNLNIRFESKPWWKLL